VPLSFRRFAVLALGAALAATQCAVQAQATPDTLGRIRTAKQIDVAYSTDSPPFSFAGEGKRPTGYSIDLCQRVIARIGRAVGVPDLRTNWIAGTVAERLELVRTGKAQLECGNTSMTLSRLSSVDFSALVFIDGGGVLVREGSPIQKFADLAGRTVGVEAGTTTEPRLRQLLGERAVDAKVVHVRDNGDGIARLESGAIEALAGDRLELVGLARARDSAAFTMLPEDLSVELIAFALPRNDAAFRLEINRALAEVYRSGDIERIFAQWLGPYGHQNGLVAALYILNAIPR
jgi:ABC-type amino acid transport substrate-binding protein